MARVPDDVLREWAHALEEVMPLTAEQIRSYMAPKPIPSPDEMRARLRELFGPDYAERKAA